MGSAMERTLEVLRSGAWLTGERVRLIAVALLIASSLGFAFLVVTADGVIDRQGRPLGTDFSDVYAAGTYVLDGEPQAPFVPERQFARERALFGEATQFYGWHYPLYFLFVAGALAEMPYGLALAVWQAVSLGLYLLAIRAIVGRTPTRQPAAVDLPLAGGGKAISDSLWLLLALAFPAVLINVGHGQNGFLTAALLGGALAILDRKPVLAGIMIGLLAYKPQFGLMIPLALLAGSRWRCLFAAVATVAVLTVATTLAFGPSIWQAFFAASEFTRTVVLEQGNTGWHKIQSVFSWARMWGAPIGLAYAIQGAVIVALGAALTWLWRGAAPYPLKAAALCLGAILATPYSLDYDMMVLAPAIAFLAADGAVRGFGPWQKTALAALWLVPLIARSIAQISLIPLGVIAMLTMFVLILRRSERGPNSSLVVPSASAKIAARRLGTSAGHDIAAFKP
jgi:alpha-1,2-mannosyltransferase